jgi:hypothetical protein
LHSERNGYGAFVLGFFSFTEVTDPHAHEAYNEWHQFDHMPEQFSIPGIVFGQRWVCSPRCADARVAVSPLLARCHYMTLYLMNDADVLPEFFALARRMHAEGRFFAERVSHLSGPFDVVNRWAADRVAISGAAVPFRPAEGVYAVVDAADPTDTPSTGRLEVFDVVGGVPEVAGAWQFAERSEVTAGPPGERRTITVAFVDQDFWGASAQLGERFAGLGTRLEWAGPLERVDPGQWVWFR